MVKKLSRSSAPVRDRKRAKKLAQITADAHKRYGGVFKRLARVKKPLGK
jgi:hypothetical protein